MESGGSPAIASKIADLKPRERRFLLLWAQHFNATKAYQAISPEANYSTARSNGTKLLSRIKKKGSSHISGE
jgi:hypothetical protein